MEKKHGSFSVVCSVTVNPIASAFAALLAPSDCRLCHEPLLEMASYAVCRECLNTLSSLLRPVRCAICAEPLPLESLAMMGLARTATDLCALCTAERPKFVRAVAGGGYDELRPAIHQMKFEGMPTLSIPLSALLADAILSLRPDAPAAMVVVPVPLYPGKRGYNQSTLLAKEALKRIRRVDPAWDLSLQAGLLRRVRRTESQYLLSHAQRKQNVHNAFEASDKLRGLQVLLVDDVYTSGATVAECSRALLKAGAAAVYVATLARAGRDTAAHWVPPPLPAARDAPAVTVAMPLFH
jgi:ComF family protein